MSTPTRDEVLAALTTYRSDLSTDQQNSIVTSALAILADSRYAGKPFANALFGVKVALARANL